MWDIVLEGTIPAAVLGIFAIMISIILTNKITKYNEKVNKKYNFLYDVYKLLINEYTAINNENGQHKQIKDVKEMLSNAQTEVFNRASKTLECIRSSFDNTKFIYTVDEVNIIELKILSVEEIQNKLYFTIFDILSNQQGHVDDIIVSPDFEIYEDRDIAQHENEFISSVNILKKYYLTQIENKLRKMLS